MSMWRVRHTFSGPQGSPWLSTMYFDETGGTAQQAATAASAFWTTVDAEMSTAVSWVLDTEVALVAEATGVTQSSTAVAAASGTGGDAAQLLPAATQALLQLRTGVYTGGKEVRGRLFIPGLTEASNDAGGVPTSFVKGVITGAATTLVGAANAQWVVWSRTHNDKHPVASTGVPNYFAVLRSRRD